MQYVKLSSKLPTKALEQQFEVKSKTNDFTKKLQCELQIRFYARIFNFKQLSNTYSGASTKIRDIMLFSMVLV